MINIICNPVNSNCPINLPSSCVYYDGPSTTNGYLPNMKLTDLLLLINSKLSGVSSIVLENSPTIDIQGVGITSNPYSFNLNLSLDENNVAEIHADGLYIPYLLYADSPSIDINGDGVAGSALTATVKISAAGGNSITVNNDGIYSAGNQTPNLQEVTDENPTTTQGIVVTGLDSLSGSFGDGLYLLKYPDSTGQIFSGDPAASGAPINISGSVISFSALNTALPSVFNTRVQGMDGTATTDFVTLGQLNASTPNLQVVTDEGAITTNSITVASAATSYIVAGSTGGSNAATAMLQGAPDDASLRFQAVGPMSIDRNSLSAFHDLIFTASNGAIITNTLYGDGRMSGAAAINPDEFVTLSQFEANSDLQTVTDNGNETTNGIQILGDGNISPASERLVLFHSTSTGESGIISYGAVVEKGRLSFFDTSVTQLYGNGDLNITSTGSTSIISSTLLFNSPSPATFTSDGITLQNVIGADATLPEHFVTFGQVSVAIPIVDTTPIASTSVDNSYMNTNYSALPIGGRVLFIDLSDDATKVLIVNKITSTTWSANADTKLT